MERQVRRNQNNEATQKTRAAQGPRRSRWGKYFLPAVAVGIALNVAVIGWGVNQIIQSREARKKADIAIAESERQHHRAQQALLEADRSSAKHKAILKEWRETLKSAEATRKKAETASAEWERIKAE